MNTIDALLKENNTSRKTEKKVTNKVEVNQASTDSKITDLNITDEFYSFLEVAKTIDIKGKQRSIILDNDAHEILSLIKNETSIPIAKIVGALLEDFLSSNKKDIVKFTISNNRFLK